MSALKSHYLIYYYNHKNTLKIIQSIPFNNKKTTKFLFLVLELVKEQDRRRKQSNEHYLPSKLTIFQRIKFLFVRDKKQNLAVGLDSIEEEDLNKNAFDEQEGLIKQNSKDNLKKEDQIDSCSLTIAISEC